MKVKIFDHKRIVETYTIKVSFPFYAKRFNRTADYYLKFLNESHYYEISIREKEDRDSKRIITVYELSLNPNEREIIEGSKPNYNRSNSHIIKHALHNEQDYSVSSEQEFNTALEQYKKYVSNISTYTLETNPELDWREWKLDKVRDSKIDKIVDDESQ
jgi:hypothetical protein